MMILYHHPFCPHSRFVRITASEYGLSPRLVEERPWERREEFLGLNPTGTTPVLTEEGRVPVPGAGVIAEYLDETRGASLSGHRLLPADIDGRVEVRRLMNWFNDKFFAEVSGPLSTERVLKRLIGSGPPAAGRRSRMRSVRRSPISAIIWPISAGWWAPATGSPASA